MLLKSLITALGPLGLVAAQSATASTCKAVQIFLVMGHGETFPGVQQSIAKDVCAGRSSCAYSNIDYPATATGNYCDIASKAISTAMNDLTSYVAKCPDSKIVLSAWSQGAWILTDVISGGGGVGKGLANGCVQPTSAPLSPTTSPGKNVVAVAVYGDPRHTANQPFNVGTAANKNGVWPRDGAQLAAENLWASKLRSYCAAGDIACANGTSSAAHGSYFGSYAATPAAWINSMLKAAS